MYSCVPHSHAIRIILMLLLWTKFVLWVFLDGFLHFQNLGWVLPSIMSFCVSDKFVFSSCSWMEKNLFDIGCLDNPFDLMIYSLNIISLMETKYFRNLTLRYKLFWILICNVGSFDCHTFVRPSSSPWVYHGRLHETDINVRVDGAPI